MNLKRELKLIEHIVEFILKSGAGAGFANLDCETDK